VKDNYVVGKKRPEMIAKVPNAKVVLFISNQSFDGYPDFQQKYRGI
jgi:hypothetical protein